MNKSIRAFLQTLKKWGRRGARIPDPTARGWGKWGSMGDHNTKMGKGKMLRNSCSKISVGVREV